MARIEELGKVTFSDVASLQTSELVLREFRKSATYEGSDAEQIANIFKKIHAKNQNFFAAPDKGAMEEEYKANAIALIDKWVGMREPDPNTHERENYKYAVTLPGNPDKIIGYIAFDEVNQARGEYRDIGYFSDPDYQFGGYATKASQIVIAAFFNDKPNTKAYNIVYITYHPDNGASRQVAKKLGFQTDNFTNTKNGKGEPREKCELTRDDFFASLKPVRTPSTDAKVVNGGKPSNIGRQYNA